MLLLLAAVAIAYSADSQFGQNRIAFIISASKQAKCFDKPN